MVLIMAHQSLPVYEFTTDPRTLMSQAKLCILSPTETLPGCILWYRQSVEL